MPALLNPRAQGFAQAFARESGTVGPDSEPWRLAAFGLRRVGNEALSVVDLEALDERLRAAPRQGQAALVDAGLLAPLGWSEVEAGRRLRALGYAPAAKPQTGRPTPWRRRGERPTADAPQRPANPASPFAALAALKAPPPAPARRKASRRRRAPRKGAAT
jgi:ATP-dependent RNA helicase SUPV3L1/SUV3